MYLTKIHTEGILWSRGSQPGLFEKTRAILLLQNQTILPLPQVLLLFPLTEKQKVSLQNLVLSEWKNSDL